MKIIKRIFKALFVLIGFILLILLAAVFIDSYNTGYLKVSKLENGEKDSYLIKNVNVIPMTKDTVLASKMVYIRDGVIQAITERIELENVEVIDAKNKFLTPGLIDMHVHVWDRYELGLYLSNGITTVRNLWGMPMHLRIKQDVANDEIVSPLFYTTGPKLTGPEFIGDDNLNLTSPDEARDKVVSYKERGYDFIKTYYGLTPDIFDAVVEQSTISDMDVIAHPSQKVPYAYHFNPQIKSVEHTEDIIQQPLNYKLDTLKLEEVIIDFKNLNRGSFSPTLTGYYNIYHMLTDDAILESEHLDYMNPLIRMVDSKAQFDRWYNTKLSDPNIVKSIKDQHDFHLYILKRLHEAGVRIVCSTDAGIGITTPGFSIHQELAFYKEAGLSNYEVLKTATINASETHSIMNNMGSVQEGKAANLLLLDRNPLEDLEALKNPSTVFVKGRKLNRETLDSFEDNAANRNNILVSAVRYAENLMVEK